MKKYITILLLFIGISISEAQTFHTIIMVNKEEQNIGRQPDRIADYNNMSTFFSSIAKYLGYKNNMLRYSGATFTTRSANQAIESLNVAENDIVVFYYSGHGGNLSRDEWPHMEFLDNLYSETALYNKLKAKSINAKMILCISDCCNMDAEGERRQRSRTYGSVDPKLVRKLFTGFDGHRGFKISASVRGEYSRSLLGSKGGAIFGIALREAMKCAMSGEIQPSMTYVLETAKLFTMKISQEVYQKDQMPQFIMDRW